MAQTTDVQRATYPLPAYNYRVDVQGVAMSFARVTGLTIGRATATYKHGLSYREGDSIVQFQHEKFEPITLERGVVIGMEGLNDWLTAGDLRTIDVNLCDEKGDPVVTWHIAKAVPVSLKGPIVDAETNEAAIESLEVLASTLSVSHPGAA